MSIGAVLKDRQILIGIAFSLIFLTFTTTIYSIYTLINSKTPYEHENHVVLLTKSGFLPHTLQIKQGDSVTFKTALNDSYWPASDSHPTHAIYPIFDPKNKILPTDSWTMTFEDIGIFEYHDHLNALATGSIEVLTHSGYETNACLSENNFNRGSSLSFCWRSELEDIYTENDLEAVFEHFKLEMDKEPLFSKNCHDILHIIGELGYEEYKKSGAFITNEETTFCTYGYYHGFIEAMLAEEGDYSSSKLYCDRIEREGFEDEGMAKNAANACRHGFGHAIFDSMNGSLWGDDVVMIENGLSACELTFDSEPDRISCSTGIANALAIGYNNYYYYLSFDHNDPFSGCRTIEHSEYRKACYVEVAAHYTHSQNLTDKESIELFKTVEEDALPDLIRTYAVNEILNNAKDYAYLKDRTLFCSDLNNEEIHKSCIEGIHIGIGRIHTPEEASMHSSRICNESVIRDRNHCRKKAN